MAVLVATAGCTRGSGRGWRRVLTKKEAVQWQLRVFHAGYADVVDQRCELLVAVSSTDQRWQCNGGSLYSRRGAFSFSIQGFGIYLFCNFFFYSHICLAFLGLLSFKSCLVIVSFSRMGKDNEIATTRNH
ncbi:hypothetical protein AB3S75_033298 [Citrus x aurantiifolia]